MKRISINAYQKALVTKRGKLISVLSEGKHWIGFNRTVTIMDITEPFSISEYLQLTFQGKAMDQYFSIVDVSDNQLGIEMKDGKYSRVISSGKYAYWNNSINYDVKIVNLDDIKVSEEIPKYILQKRDMLKYLSVFAVESYQKSLVYIDGEYSETLNSGVYYYWKTDKVATVKTVDERIQLMDVSGQEILTKDKAGLRVNFTLQYQVDDIMLALNESQDYVKQLYTSVQLVLREYIGTMTLDQLLANKESIGSYITEKSQPLAKVLGIKIISGGIKDIILPGDVKDIMNHVLVAQKKAQANSIMRHEETASTRSLLNTAKLMEQNTMLMKLKEMEYMEKIADKIGEISINGKGRVVDQLADLLVTTQS